MTIPQDVDLYASMLEGSEDLQHILGPGRSAWLQVARGEVELNGIELGPGDGAAITAESELDVTGRESELLLFDLD